MPTIQMSMVIKTSAAQRTDGTEGGLRDSRAQKALTTANIAEINRASRIKKKDVRISIMVIKLATINMKSRLRMNAVLSKSLKSSAPFYNTFIAGLLPWQMTKNWKLQSTRRLLAGEGL